MFNHTPSGFHMTFANGYTLSVQWGPGNYCDNKGARYGHAAPESRTAEVAVWDTNDEWVKLSENDNVRGWQTVEDVVTLMAVVASLKPGTTVIPPD